MQHGIRVAAAIALAVFSPGVVAVQEAPPAPADVGVLGSAEPLLVTDYHVEVLREGPAYQASAQMALRNPRSTGPVEGVALLPLPERSIARGFICENGDVRMKGNVRSRTRAVDVYRDITRGTRPTGRDPAVLERLGDRWLRATISPIAASGQVRLTVGYLGFTEKLGDRREVVLPSDRTAYRSSWAGSSRRLLPGEWTPGPLTTWCFRAPGADGTFCLEIDPSQILSTPLPRATYLLVLETPESTSEEFAKAGGAALAELLNGIAPDDSVEYFANGVEGGFFGGAAVADSNARDRLAAALANVHSGGWGHLDQRLRAALATAATVSGPVRIVVASAQRKISQIAELEEEVERARIKLGSSFGLFTCALGSRADAASLATLAAAGGGRAFSILAGDETAIVAKPFAAAARRPVLFAPHVTVAGASELMVEEKSHVTYGETLRVSGRYVEGVTALVRLEGGVLDGRCDVMWDAPLDDENVAHPWVATIWAGLRARELRLRATGDDAVSYLVRLCERFGLIGAETVSLGLEPALENRLPPLMGAGWPGGAVTQLDTPEQPPARPGNPEIPDGETRDRRPPPPGGGPLGPPGPNGPTARPQPFAPPSAPPSVPNPGPAGPSGRAPAPSRGRG